MNIIIHNNADCKELNNSLVEGDGLAKKQGVGRVLIVWNRRTVALALLDRAA